MKRNASFSWMHVNNAVYYNKSWMLFSEVRTKGWRHNTVSICPSLFLVCLCRIVNVSLPKKTRNNGTLYALIFVHQAGVTPWQDSRQVHSVAQLTTYMVPKPPEISLISGDDQTQVQYFKPCNWIIIWWELPSLSTCLRHDTGPKRSSPAEETAGREPCSRWWGWKWIHIHVRSPSVALAFPSDTKHCQWPLPVWQRIPAKWRPQIPQSVRQWITQ